MPRFGTVRKVDRLGRLVIPIELRRVLGFGDEGAQVEMLASEDGETLLVRRYRGSCVFCGLNTPHMVLTKRVCSDCMKQLAAGVVDDGGDGS